MKTSASDMKMPVMLIGAILIAAATAPACSAGRSAGHTATPLIGHWEGTMIREGSRLDVTFDFIDGPEGVEGRFSAMSMRALDVPLARLRTAAPAIGWDLGGDATTTVFKGDLQGDLIEGSFEENGHAGRLSLRRRPLPPAAYRVEDVRVIRGDVTLAGSLLIPRHGGQHPAVVILHGSGPEGRHGGMFLADALARGGVAALVTDKRGVGQSGGDWRVAGFEDLADDAIAAVALLRRRPEIDPSRVGLYGHSQGGFIAPLAASRSADVAFVVAAASYGGPAWEQDLHRVEQAITGEGFTDGEQKEALALYRRFVDAARSGTGKAEFRVAADRARGRRWVDWLDLPPDDHWIWEFYRRIGNYNALDHWSKVRVPVLLIHGGSDAVVPVGRSLEAIETTLRAAGHRDHTILVLPRAGHNLNVEPGPGQPFDWPRVAAGFPGIVVSWVRATAPP